MDAAHFFSRSVNSGVTQGSVLGHLLFVLKVFDLPYLLGSSVFSDVDDTKIHYYPTTGTAKLQTDLNRLCVWYDYRLLALNLEKGLAKGTLRGVILLEDTN